jgi:hypothetical protein
MRPALRHGPDEEGDIGPGERLLRVGGANGPGEQGKGTVVQLHRHTFECRQGWLDLEHLKHHRGLTPEHFSG